jgi:hypothetical protein
MPAFTQQDSHHHKIYFDRFNLAPYLRISPHTDDGGDNYHYESKGAKSELKHHHQHTTTTAKDDTGASSARDNEADAAAGGTASSVLQRVSSFSIIPRPASSLTLAPGATAAAASSASASAMAPGVGTMDPRRLLSPTGAAGTAAASTGAAPLTPGAANKQATAAAAAGSSPYATQYQDVSSNATAGIAPTWRLRDRMKTVGVGLVMALNVGTDPPDLTKPHPSAILQCWMDPTSCSRARAKEKIGERLEAQYARWQQQRQARPLKYRRALDPTVEDVRALCLWLRRQARNERILLHYNGHGVPRPTANGEIWVFDKNHTEYIPLSITDLRQWMGKPSIVILDCSSAGILIPFLTAPISPEGVGVGGDGVNDDLPTTAQRTASGGEADQQEQYMETMSSKWVRDTIVLCPTSEGEWLPMHPGKNKKHLLFLA